MKERPILMSAPMVRAILAGTKTQTRRLIRPQPEWRHGVLFKPGETTGVAKDLFALDGPHRLGDLLWGRESFSGPWCMEAQDGCAAVPPSKWGDRSRIWYWADGEPTDGDWTRPRPSIYMPRWASRILLEITDIRVERLQDISEADAVAEGIVPHRKSGWWWEQPPDGLAGTNHFGARTARDAYLALWESINGPGSWGTNPWVWVVSFNRVRP